MRNAMGYFVDNIAEPSLDSWYRLLTYFAIGLPILGAILGGLCGIAAFRVSSRISDLQAIALNNAENAATEARELARQRCLSSDHTAKMLVVARQFCSEIKRIPVTAANGNQEAQAYALDFVKVFKDAGCTSDLELPIPGLTPDVQGVRVGVRSSADIPAEVGLIGKILVAGEISYRVNPLTPEFSPGEPFVLIIGAKSVQAPYP
jgi:hypothetical protein